MTEPERSHRTWVCVALAALVYAIAYAPTTWAEFIWDDPDYIIHNRTLRDAEGLFRMWFEPGSIPQYYPLVHTTFWIEFQLWGLDPLGYHLVNWVLHGANAWLVYRLLQGLGFASVAGLAATVFLLHPVHVESVAWVTERKNVLSGLFYLLAWLTWLRFRRGEGSTKLWWAALGLFAAALLSKSVTATLPAAILLLDWYRDGRLTRKNILALVPFFLLGIAAGLHTAWIEAFNLSGTGKGASGAEWSLSFVERLLVVGRTFWFYPAKIVWPEPLVFIYPRFEIDAGSAVQWLWPVATLATLGTLFALRQRIGRGPITAAFFHAGTLLPALGFLNVYPFRYSFVADHFQYLASLGAIVLVGTGLVRLLPKAPVAALAAILAVPLAALAHRHARAFTGVEPLWTDTIAKNERCWMAHRNLAERLMDRGDLDNAEHHFKQTLAIKPDHRDARLSLGVLELRRQPPRLEQAESIFRTVVNANPEYGAGWANLGLIAAMRKQLPAAMDLWRKALRFDPRYDPARQNLASALLSQQQLAEARTLLEEAIELHPYTAEFYALLADCLRRQRDAQGAYAHATRALELDPGNQRARRILGQ